MKKEFEEHYKDRFLDDSEDGSSESDIESLNDTKERKKSEVEVCTILILCYHVLL